MFVSWHAQQPPFVYMHACLWCVCMHSYIAESPALTWTYPLSGPILDSFASSPCHRFFLFPCFPLLSPFVQVRFSLLVTPQNVYIKKRHESSLLATSKYLQGPVLNLFPLRKLQDPIISEGPRVDNSDPFVYFTDMN